MKEVLIASLGLLLVPKSIQINIEDFFGKNLCLPVGYAYNLENNADMVYKLNTVSETINDISKTYENDEEDIDGGALQKRKEAFIEEAQEKIQKLKDNVLYDDFLDEENTLLSDIFDILVQNDLITKKDILDILESHNEYVLGFEDFDTNMKIEEDINVAARFLNEIYKIEKLNNLWKLKLHENKKAISSQLSGVSRTISKVANSIRDDEINFEEIKKEIDILCKQKNIEILDMKIKKEINGRYILNLYK